MKRYRHTIANQAFPIAHFGIIDNDRLAATVMRARLRMRFPNSEVVIYNKPVVDEQLDVYFVDSNFYSSPLATQLLRKVLKVNPNCMVVTMSSRLENESFVNRMNESCHAVYDKTQPANSEPIFEFITHYLNVLNRIRSSRHTPAVREPSFHRGTDQSNAISASVAPACNF